MDHGKLKRFIRRRLPHTNIVIQCDADTTPEHLRERGMVCAILTWVPERDDDGNLIEEGFTKEEHLRVRGGDQHVETHTHETRYVYVQPSAEPTNEPEDDSANEDE